MAMMCAVPALSMGGGVISEPVVSPVGKESRKEPAPILHLLMMELLVKGTIRKLAILQNVLDLVNQYLHMEIVDF